MNQETIEIHIKNLGKTDFDSVASLILEKIFLLKAVDVDGKGDGGSDFWFFNDDNANLVAAQKTIQDQNWYAKALRDAEKSKTQLNAKRYFFLTSRAHQPKSFRDLENEIGSKLQMPSTCMGATEIAGLIVHNGLLGDFAHAINLPLDIAGIHRPDKREILLHTYYALSDDRSNLRNEIFDNAILLIIHNSVTGLNREDAICQTMNFLGIDETRRHTLESRIDSLLARGNIAVNRHQGNILTLGSEKKKELQIAESIYVKELGQLSTIQSDIVSQFGGVWDNEKAEKASYLLAQTFVGQQIETARHSSLSFTMTGLIVNVTNSMNDLKTLIGSSGIKDDDVNEVLKKMVDTASDSALIKKLINAVTFVALENSSPNKTSAILGASHWKEIKIILDASVAIPYLTCTLFVPSKGHFSRGANATVSTLRKYGARLAIPWHYINECASHLVGAVEYCRDLPEFEDSFLHSENGYVAHYYQLRNAGEKVPSSLKEYIEAISSSATQTANEKYDLIRKVMHELQPLLHEQGVEFEPTSKYSDKYRKDIETEFTYYLRELNKQRTQNLIEHDVNVLSHIMKCCIEDAENMICLTWDGIMIAVGSKLQNVGWIVSPQEAADLIQSRLSLSDASLMSLAHGIAQTMERPALMGARFIDRVVLLSGDRLADWEYRRKIKEHRDQAIRRIDITQGTFDVKAFDQETDKFLQEQGVDIPENHIGSEQS